MGSMLFRILGIALLVWVIQRVLRIFLRQPGAGPSKDPAAQPNQMVKDPVCGMYMDARLAVRLQEGQEELFFCSEECKRKFLSVDAGKAGSAASD